MRLFITSLTLLLCSTTFSQTIEKMETKFENQSSFQKKHTVIPSKATVLYSNDLSNGAEWSVHNTSSPNTDWQITTNLNASPVADFQPAGFATAANGYGIIDSDSQGFGATQDAYLELNTRITACTNEPYVLLRFRQMLRRYNDTTTIEVSNNGTTWTEFLCNSGLDNNTNTANPDLIDINISSVAGNEDSVYIRFRYRAEDAWFWAIDDVEIVRQDSLDLKGLTSEFGTTGNWGLRMPYYQIPPSQIQPIEITGRVLNKGFANQDQVVVNATSASSFSSTSLTDVLLANQSGYFDLLTFFLPSTALGVKTVNLTADSPALDAEPSNNDLEPVTVEVHDKYYARSTDVRTGRVTNGFFQYGFEAGNIFDIYTQETLSSAMVHVNDESTPGMPLVAKIYEALDQQGTFTLLETSDTVFIPALTSDQVFRARFDTLVTLEAGKSYLLTAGSTGSAVLPGLVIGTSGKSDIFTSYYKASNSTDWFSFTEAPMVKMNFESVLAVKELDELMQVSIYPNPSKGIYQMDLPKQGNTTVSVYDISGKLIQNLETSGNLILDLSNNESGIYIVNLSNAQGSAVKRIVKQ